MIVEPKSKFGLELKFQLKVAQKLINRAPYAAFCVEENAQFLYVNDATYSLLGYSRKEILSMTLQEVDTNWEPEKWSEQWKLLKQQGSINFKTWYRKKTGNTLPVEITFVLEELEGNLVCCGYACDQSKELQDFQLQQTPKNKKSPNIQNGLEEKIVEYQKKDNELRTSLSLLNSTLDSTANGILAINIEGEILYYNQKFIDIWDLPADVKISRNCSEAKAPFESQVQIWEFPTVSDSETYILLELKDDKQAESELRQALEQARRLSELRQRFVSMLCHQFRTPLNVVSFSSDLLRRNIHQWSKEKNHSYLDLIQDAVEQISELLDEILLFGKAEADRLKCEPRELDLNQFCQGIIAQIYLAEGKQNAINFISGGECSTKNVDPKLLQHILTNLLSNAIKYSVGSNAVDLKLICGDNHVIFQIKDKGIGIPAVDREQIFEPFYRGTNIDNIPGTGLGLSIVKTLADLHGCEISLSSKVGTGTTFILKVPSTNN